MLEISSKRSLNNFSIISTVAKRIEIFFAITLLIFSNIIVAEEIGTQNLLSKMSEAVRTLNYQGRFMYVVGSDMSSFQVQHALIDGKEHERLVFLNQKQQEVVRIGHDIFCIHPGNHLLRQHETISTNPFSEKLSKLSQGIYDNYDVLMEKDHMVAGKSAYKLSFKSKDSNRFDHNLWIDEQSYLLLKADISDPMQGTLESFEYVQIEIGKVIPASEFSHKNYVQHKPKHFDPAGAFNVVKETDQHESNENVEKGEWNASWLPDGFYFSGETQQFLKGEGESQKSIKVKMLMYTDGIAAITAFIEARDKANSFSESSQKGAVSAYSHSLKFNQQDFMITVVGEVQLKTVERIAKGIQPQSKAALP